MRGQTKAQRVVIIGFQWWIGRLCALVVVLTCGPAYAAPTDPPTREVSIEAAALVQQMKVAPRGPYSRLRWYCNDGTIHPPTPYPCGERGGGRQHAEYSGARARLAELGYHVGTIYAALPWGEFYDPEHRFQRMRELPLERYLQEIDDGWVLQRAQHYRGRTQAEGENAAGRALLLELFDDGAWFRANYLLARELARTVPHGADTALTRSVRRDAIELVALDPAADALRVEIHGAPSAATAAKVRAWAATADVAARDKAVALADDLDALFGASGRRERIQAQVEALSRLGVEGAWLTALPDVHRLAAVERIVTVGDTLALLRAAAEADVSAIIRLELLTLLDNVEADLVTLHASLRATQRPRSEQVTMAAALTEGVYGVGLLSPGERRAVQDALSVAGRDDASFTRAVQLLQRVPQWAAGSVHHAFAEALAAYTALDPRAQRFVDDLLRSSPLALLGDLIQALGSEARALTGIGTSLFDRDVAGVVGLNAGIASGPLRVFATRGGVEGATPDRGDIVVLPETTADLTPVAGIITLGEGSPVSHVQLLARNFGIPNVAIAPAALAALEGHADQRVTLVVGTDGTVVLLDEEVASARAPFAGAPADDGLLTVPPPDLSRIAPIPLDALDRSLSGRVVGPKAANLGELNRLFPGRVAPAVALPFGAFDAHTREGHPSIRQDLEQIYAAARRESWTDERLGDALAGIRERIASVTLDPSTRAGLVSAMDDAFGSPGSYGLFVRSDTNVEDLPQFTGAGLSETVPNVVGLEEQLATIPRVWSSVLSPRAIAWRSRLLTNPTEIYASVLLMRSVPSTKSGVLVTINLIDRDQPGLTVATAWGVGGAVAGEAAETLVLRPNGATQLVSEAKAPYQRRLGESGGVVWTPAPDGPVLTSAERVALRALAEEVNTRYGAVLDGDGRPRPWDIEFGFVDGELTLFQIRPLVERGQQRADRLAKQLMTPTNVVQPEGAAMRPAETP